MSYLKIVFVVLHFCAISDTNECIESIRNKIDTKEYKIIVVDNASPDRSYKELQQKYADSEDVDLIHNETNVGFAKGNNIGIEFANRIYNPQFIVALNNDICLLQQNIFKIIEKSFKKYKFSVMGPLILTKDGKFTSNPKGNKIFDKYNCMKSIKRAERILSLNKLGLGSLYLQIERIKNYFLNKTDNYNDKLINNQLNVILHGSFLIFSQEYFKYFSGFDESTFLYMEEEILYKHLMEHNLISLFTTNYAVYHKEDSSTNILFKNSRKKIDFVLKNNLKSLKIYLNLLNEE